MKPKWIFFCQLSQILFGNTGAWRPVSGRTCQWSITRPTGGTLPLWPASRSHCWTVVRESVCRIWHSSSKTWRRKNVDSYLARLWDLVPGISPWALGHERVEGKCAAGNGIHAGKTWRMEGWASQFQLNTESSGSQIVPLAGPEIQNCYFSF